MQRRFKVFSILFLMKPQTAEIFSQAAKCSLIPYHTADALLPIITSSRNASAIPFGYLGIRLDASDYDSACNALENSSQYQRMKDLDDFGVKLSYTVEPVLTGGRLTGVVYLHKGDETRLQTIRGHFRRANDDIRAGRFSDDYFKGVALVGEFLGYPKCCTDKYVNDKMNGMRILAEAGKLGVLEDIDQHEETLRKAAGAAESRASNQLDEMFSADANTRRVRTVMGLSAEKRMAYFTLAHFPCRPECEAARSIGERVAESFSKFDEKLGEEYRETILPTNMAFVWALDLELVISTNNYLSSLVNQCRSTNLYSAHATDQRTTAKIGRNEPCPCGSKVKYKKCCGGH